MTVARIAEIVHGWLGWCPRETGLFPQGPTRGGFLNPASVAPPAGAPFVTRVMDWLGLFRNQMIVMALYFSAVGVLLSFFLGGLDLPMFIAGLGVGSLLSVFQGFRFWKAMNEVRDEGAVLLSSLYDKTSITVVLIVTMVPVAVTLGAVPGITMAMMNSISGGLIFVLFWWSLLVVWIWESQEKRYLRSDGLLLSLAKETQE